jgi:hypothetical protein
LHLARVILLTPFQDIHDLASPLIGWYDRSNTASFFVHDGGYQMPNFAKLLKSDKSPGAGCVETSTKPAWQRSTPQSHIQSPSSPFPPPQTSTPTFIHLDRPCDHEIVAHFVHQGHAMNGNMSNVGDTCAAPEKVLKEGATLLKSRFMAWGVNREHYDRLMSLSEVKRGSPRRDFG